jgi:hypothetical protein
MSDLHLEAVANRIGPVVATFASLQQPLARLIFLALPSDARGRASCVCRAWRDTLADPSLWFRLDMTVVRVEKQRFIPVLHGAAAAGRARSQLRQLDLSQLDVSLDDLLPVLTANTGSLRELHLNSVNTDNFRFETGYERPTVEAAVTAAPLLQVLTAKDVSCTLEDAPGLLRAQPPFALLQIRHRLEVSFPDDTGSVGGLNTFAPFAAALADAALQPALFQLWLWKADTGNPAVMGALVDAVLARRPHELVLEACTPPAAAPLARLLATGSLTSFMLCQQSSEEVMQPPAFDTAGAALVADALRVNTTLTKLDLCNAGLCRDLRVAGALLSALVGHPSLRELDIADYIGGTFGPALAELIAADTPALQSVMCHCDIMGDHGWAPIVEALPLNHHLRKLYVWSHYSMSDVFARERLLPAVRANTSLKSLRCVFPPTGPAAEAEELVRRRGQHD